jgi:3-oxoacyl-[acyl-carrier protein] reductase
MAEKVCVITGGANGIGLATARMLAEQGEIVVLADWDEEALARSEQELAAAGAKVLAVPTNVAEKESVQALFAKVRQEYGHLDVLVNSAGICRLTPIDELSVEEWDLMMDVNLKGTFLCSQAAVPFFKAQKSGNIVNISSVAGKLGGIAVGPHYSASKAGVICLTLSFAKYLVKDGVRVNAVAPGPITTNMTDEWPDDVRERMGRNIPLTGRMGTVEEVANVIMFLISDQSAFITGEIIDVNGGVLMDI